MPAIPLPIPPTAAGDDLIAALGRYARDHAQTFGAEDGADVELALMQLQKLATIGRIAADVAHEFGNLMTVILGYSELLLGAAEHGQMPERDQCAELRRAAERASGLTSRLLSYSRRSTDEPAPLDLGLVVGGLTPMLGRLLGAGAVLAVKTDPVAGAVMADVKQIEQLVMNLVINARDAIAAGGRVEVAVEPARLTEPLDHALGTAPVGDYVRLRVRDDGRGMGPETLAQLFRPFVTTMGRGAGLGLTIVARLARKADAAVVVTSAPGAGTTVDLYLPRLSAAGNGLPKGFGPDATARAGGCR
jgi:two-component system cell cycle sensor histidine kinase/response regulator CckA